MLILDETWPRLHFLLNIFAYLEFGCIEMYSPEAGLHCGGSAPSRGLNAGSHRLNHNLSGLVLDYACPHWGWSQRHSQQWTRLIKHIYRSGYDGLFLPFTLTDTFISLLPLSSSLSPFQSLRLVVFHLPSPIVLFSSPSPPPLPSVMVAQCSLLSSSAGAAPSLVLVPSFPECLISLA